MGGFEGGWRWAWLHLPRKVGVWTDFSLPLCFGIAKFVCRGIKNAGRAFCMDNELLRFLSVQCRLKSWKLWSESLAPEAGRIVLVGLVLRIRGSRGRNSAWAVLCCVVLCCVLRFVFVFL